MNIWGSGLAILLLIVVFEWKAYRTDKKRMEQFATMRSAIESCGKPRT